MPYLHLISSKPISDASKESIRAIVCRTISLIPGKSFDVTTIHIEDNAAITKGSNGDPVIFIEIRLFGPAPLDTKKAFVRAFSEELERETGVEQKYIAFNISELDSWGGNGEFFTRAE